MPISHKGAISFGLVHIPVALHTATQDNDIRFNQLCKSDLSRVRYKKVCAGCGAEVTSNADIVKGFEYDKDQYVVITDEDFEKIKTERDRSIQILHFTDLASIRPIYYDKTYHVLPEAGGERAFSLLWRAMLDEQKVAIGKTVLGTKETLLCILPTDSGLLIETLFFADEIRSLPREVNLPEPAEQELAMAKTLISSMDRPFEPAAYHDEYQARLRKLIEDKIAGREVVTPAAEAPGNVVDLMQALKASIEQQGKKPQRAPRKKGAS
ncbi:Ku protein [Feifania hominis]|uniref:Non-homologous end joining protein Ku n=1 Tax=Feifania hominis TaxID=2763660 RepID=A0A926DBG4_9FIRM|nr:Ku protein [Feifania hominis]MBC8535915.1 Ku protein [Feifania hominis]